MSDTPEKSARPLSPHLQVYRPQMTSMLSILHRATGAALAVGLIMVAWWLLAAAAGPEAYEMAMEFAASPVGLILLAGWSFSLYYHTLNGIRHLIWDTGRLFNIKCATMAGYVVFWGAMLLTVGTWVWVYV